MGASEWKYRIECAPAESPAQVFERLQLREMAGDDYLWDDDCIGPRPRTIAQLKAGRGPEFGQQGTHSILDMYGVLAADETDDRELFAAVRAITEDEASQVFGTPRPSPAQFDETAAEPLGPHWTGSLVRLYENDVQVAMGFWGYSGD